MKRVEWLSGLIALEMGLTSEVTARLKRAAVNHDIGEDLKPWLFYDNRDQDFTQDNVLEAKSHPRDGAEMLLENPLAFGVREEDAAEVSVMIEFHHEHFESSREKCRTRAKELGIQFRKTSLDCLVRCVNILKVADYFFARAEKRPYQKEQVEGKRNSKEILTPTEILDVMAFTVGRQFCPDTYKALVELKEAAFQYVTLTLTLAS
ncbi:MAG: HD domain-containing protein [Candidatus Zambryskibacteria bacterium]|nr:HD domain-containing protein [Candidatus Zambryskibacteria bacterium]